MKQTTERTIKKNIANFFGSSGYLFCFLQWFWAVLLYFSVIQSITSSLSPSVDTQAGQPPSFTLALPGPLEMIILAAITIIMVAITVYILVKIPAGIVKTSNKTVHKTVDAIVPVVIKARHEKDTKKNRAKLTAKLLVTIKLLAVIIPIGVSAASGLLEKQSVDYSIAMVISYGLACFAAVFFALQYLLARLFRTKTADLW